MSKISPVDTMPTVNSQSQDWINWHKLLKSDLGKKTADYLFVKTWQERGSDDANTTSLRGYLEQEGIDIEKGVLSSLADVGGDVTDIFGSMFKTTKAVGIVILVVLIIFVFFTMYNIFKNPEGTAKIVSSARGR